MVSGGSGSGSGSSSRRRRRGRRRGSCGRSGSHCRSRSRCLLFGFVVVVVAAVYVLICVFLCFSRTRQITQIPLLRLNSIFLLISLEEQVKSQKVSLVTVITLSANTLHSFHVRIYFVDSMPCSSVIDTEIFYVGFLVVLQASLD